MQEKGGADSVERGVISLRLSGRSSIPWIKMGDRKITVGTRQTTITRDGSPGTGIGPRDIHRKRYLGTA